MRYVVVVLLLASPAFSGEPVYSWRPRADDPERVYLYLDGKQIGGWCYSDKHYRPFDGTNWGAPTATAPVRPPERVSASPQPKPMIIAQPKPIVITQPISTLPPLRGPLRVRFATATSHIITDMTMKIIEEIPGAIVDSLKRGDYQIEFKSSVTPSAQQPQVQITPPSPSQPAQSPQRRWIIPRR